MKKAFKTLAAVLCCATVLFLVNACSDPDMPGGNAYSYGFDKFDSTSLTSVQEMTYIKSVFENSFRQELGVTVGNDSFKYNGNVSKVKTACDKAVKLLQNTSFDARFTFVVRVKNAKGTSVVFTWSK